MQGEESARRIIDIGAEPDRVVVTGSLKFDSMDVRPARRTNRGRNRVLRYFRITSDRPVLIAASHPQGRRGVGLRGVPAHSRAGAEHAADRGAAQARAVRRSRADRPARRLERRAPDRAAASTPNRGTTWSCWTSSASWRSSIRWRRPSSSAAAWSTREGTTSSSRRSSARPSCSVPTCRTSRRSPGRSSSTRPRSRCARARELEHALLGLLNDPVRRAKLGAAARALVEANRGARGKTMTAIARVLSASGSRQRPPVPDRPLTVPPHRRDAALRRAIVIAQIYAAGARYRRRSIRAHPDRQRRLVAPRHQHRQSRGRRPLQDAARGAGRRTRCAPWASARRSSVAATRAARRRTASSSCASRIASRADIDRAGDEPLMLARQLDGVAVLVCSDRYLAGRLAEHHFGTTVHVLDDGFQHFQLYRDIDVVGSPGRTSTIRERCRSGRLREPLDAIAEADAIIALDEESTRPGRSAADVARLPTLGTARLSMLPVAGPRPAARPRWRSPASRAPTASSRICAPAAGRSPAQLPFSDHHRLLAQATSSACSAPRDSTARSRRGHHGKRSRPAAAVSPVSPAGGRCAVDHDDRAAGHVRRAGCARRIRRHARRGIERPPDDAPSPRVRRRR